MIELNEDCLRFSFPQADGALWHLTQKYIEETLPRILAQDRRGALNRLLKNDPLFAAASETERSHLPALVRALPPDMIAETFEGKVHERWRRHRDGSRLEVSFQRTLRIPDNGQTYYLPPGLGEFPLRHLDDFAGRVPRSWLKRGGVLMPMYQAEALWIYFRGSYPCAVKIASGRINAVTGEAWRPGLSAHPQDYVVAPRQPWLDGFAVEKGVIRQFVAMPLGAGYSVEEQLTGEAEYGGLQLQVFPLKADVHFRKSIEPDLPKDLAELLPDLLPAPRRRALESMRLCCCAPSYSLNSRMGLGAGGRMRQQIFEDPHGLDAWDLEDSSRCFVHLCNALVWRQITGANPPHPPVTAAEYEEHGLPWFDFYRDDLAVLEGSKQLAGVKSVGAISKKKGDQAIPANESVKEPPLVHCGPDRRPRQVREWEAAQGHGPGKPRH